MARSLAPFARGAIRKSAVFFCFFSLRQHKEKKTSGGRNNMSGPESMPNHIESAGNNHNLLTF